MIENFGDKANTQGFRENPQNINKAGRPKKIYTIIKQMGYSKDDVRACFGELLWYTHNELTDLVEDTTKPIITQIVAKALLLSKEKGEISKIKDLLEQTIGKANQRAAAVQNTTSTTPVFGSNPLKD